MNTATLISIFGILISTFGVSLVFKDYLASLMAGVIVRRIKHVRAGVRIKILTAPVLKGDVLSVGPLRTSLLEVGDGEHLPSVQTGRIIKVPNFILVNNPILLYGEDIIDEVIAYERPPLHHIDSVEEDMREAIISQGHQPIEVGLYEKEDKLVVHGIFRVRTQEMADVRSRILKSFLERRASRRGTADGGTATSIGAAAGRP